MFRIEHYFQQFFVVSPLHITHLFIVCYHVHQISLENNTPPLLQRQGNDNNSGENNTRFEFKTWVNQGHLIFWDPQYQGRIRACLMLIMVRQGSEYRKPEVDPVDVMVCDRRTWFLSVAMVALGISSQNMAKLKGGMKIIRDLHFART